jgi:lipoprotein-releasing system ATP-binding protein
MGEGGEEEPALRLVRVGRRYPAGDGYLEVLTEAEFAIRPGEIVALVAPSGTGKSTLLHVAGLLERPDEGEVVIAGRPTTLMADAERTRIRREEIGFVYQFHYLLPEFSAVENVILPQMIRGLSRGEAKTRAAELLSFSAWERG